MTRRLAVALLVLGLCLPAARAGAGLDEQPPEISILNPPDGSNVAGASATLLVEVVDASGFGSRAADVRATISDARSPERTTAIVTDEVGGRLTGEIGQLEAGRSYVLTVTADAPFGNESIAQSRFSAVDVEVGESRVKMNPTESEAVTVASGMVRVMLTDVTIEVGDASVDWTGPAAHAGLGVVAHEIPIESMRVELYADDNGTRRLLTAARPLVDSRRLPVFHQFAVLDPTPAQQRVKAAMVPVGLRTLELLVPLDSLSVDPSDITRARVSLDSPADGYLPVCQGAFSCGAGQVPSQDPIPVVIDDESAGEFTERLAIAYMAVLGRAIVESIIGRDPAASPTGAVDECRRKVESYIINSPLPNPRAAGYYCQLALWSELDSITGSHGDVYAVGRRVAECSMWNEPYCSEAIEAIRRFSMDHVREHAGKLIFGLARSPIDGKWALVNTAGASLDSFGVEYPNGYPTYALINTTVGGLAASSTVLARPCLEAVPCVTDGRQSIAAASGYAPVTGEVANEAICMRADGSMGDGSDCYQWMILGADVWTDYGDNYYFWSWAIAPKGLNDGAPTDAIGLGFDSVESWNFVRRDAWRYYNYNQLTQYTDRDYVYHAWCNWEFDAIDWYSEPLRVTYSAPGHFAEYENAIQYDGKEVINDVDCRGYWNSDRQLDMPWVELVLTPVGGSSQGGAMGAGILHNRKRWSWEFSCGASGGFYARGPNAGVYCSVSPTPKTEGWHVEAYTNY